MIVFIVLLFIILLLLCSALARIYECIADAVTKCESLEYYALITLQSQEMAFKQCNITFRPLISHNITEQNNNNKTVGKEVFVVVRYQLIAKVCHFNLFIFYQINPLII